MTASQGTTVGVVGDRSFSTVVEDAGAAATAGAAVDVLAADPDLVVAVGDASLADLTESAPSVPVLAVDVEPGVPSVSRQEAPAAIAAVLDGAVPETARRRFEASAVGSADDESTATGTFLRDVMLVTGEPARISEYSVRSGDELVARFRADGVVVATPAGSPGYLAAAGGPIVEPGTGTLAVVPVAPFETDSEHWVLDDAGVTLAAHRDEPVVLVTDGTERGRVSTDTPVELVPAGELRLFAPGEDWKNSNGTRSE